MVRFLHARLKTIVDDMSSERSVSHCIQIFGEVTTGDWNHEILAALLQDTKTALAFTSKDLLTPLRHAVTGMKVRSVRNRIHV